MSNQLIIHVNGNNVLMESIILKLYIIKDVLYVLLCTKLTKYRNCLLIFISSYCLFQEPYHKEDEFNCYRV